jgi:outer membrane protein assembly factor BamC
MPVTSTRPARALQRLTLVAAAAALAACTSTDFFSGDKIDYRSKAAKTSPLEVPPDLSQLSREARFVPQAGSVSATTYQSAAAAPTAAPAAGAPTIALDTRGEFRVERIGNERWLVTSLPPEALWSRIKGFWQERGFTIVYESPDAGVMETDWAENRAKLPQDFVRNTIGRVLDGLWSTGERDKFRTRIERTASGGSEIFISHRGLVEVYVAPQQAETKWTTRPSDPQLEAEFLTRLMMTLGAPEAQARVAVAEAPQRPERARVLAGGPGAALQVDEPFDRAWRRVGLALDRAGFTVEDRDRAGGLYFVRYVDPGVEARESSQPGFFGRLLSPLTGSRATAAAPVRYRIAVRADGDARTTVAVLDAQGAPVADDVGRRIVASLVQDLK